MYKTRIKRNLKKCAASWAKPAIQYVLKRVNCQQPETPVQQTGSSHSRNDDGRYDPKRDHVEDEAGKEPSGGTIVQCRPLPQEQGPNLYDMVQSAEGRERDECTLNQTQVSAS